MDRLAEAMEQNTLALKAEADRLERAEAEAEAGDVIEPGDEWKFGETMMLDEVALRKPDFVAGVSMTLADGQVWSLPSPSFSPSRRSSADASRGAKARPRRSVVRSHWTAIRISPSSKA